MNDDDQSSKFDRQALLNSALRKRQAGQDDEKTIEEDIALAYNQCEADAIRSENREPSWDYWRLQDLWTLDNACMLVYGVDPAAYSLTDKNNFIAQTDMQTRPPWVNLYHTATGAIKAGNLISHEKSTVVSPPVFLNWATTKGVTLPEQLPINEVIAEESLKEPERVSLLKMVLGMAIEGYGYVPKSNQNGKQRSSASGDKSGSICADLKLCGLNLADDTIRKYLKLAEERFPNAKLTSKGE